MRNDIFGITTDSLGETNLIICSTGEAIEKTDPVDR